jgi:hypothetical protein
MKNVGRIYIKRITTKLSQSLGISPAHSIVGVLLS